MKNNILFIYLMIWYIFWIWLNNYTENFKTSLLVLLILVVLFLWIILKNKKIVKIIYIIISIFLWIIISNNNLINIEDKLEIIKKYEYKEIEINVKIINTEKIEDDSIVYNAKIIDLDWDKIENDVNILVYSKASYNLNYWDLIKYNSKIYEIKDFWTFKYKKYLLSNNIYAKTYLNFVEEKIEKESFKKDISIFRQSLLKKIKEIYPKEEAIFLWWILLWAREELPEKLKQNFNNSWLTHFIAVSGFNITIIIVFISIITKKLPSFIKVPITIISIILFTILVWTTAPVIRASIMWIIGYLIINLWRNQNIMSTILLTWIIMLSYSPLSINYDVSFQLSFLAVFWIYYCKPYLDKKLSFLTNTLEMRDAITLTLSALSFSLPIMIFGFWQLSILSPITNLLVAWTIPISMLLWFISVIFYSFSYYLWIISWFFAYLFLSFDIYVVNFFWELDFSIISYDFWENWSYMQTIYFIVLVFIILWFRKKESD